MFMAYNLQSNTWSSSIIYGTILHKQLNKTINPYELSLITKTTHEAPCTFRFRLPICHHRGRHCKKTRRNAHRGHLYEIETKLFWGKWKPNSIEIKFRGENGNGMTFFLRTETLMKISFSSLKNLKY
jgi:hypothetical protein